MLVRSTDRQWRYSRFPSVPLFGRAARENQLAVLEHERDELAERPATLSLMSRKCSVLIRHSAVLSAKISRWPLRLTRRGNPHTESAP